MAAGLSISQAAKRVRVFQCPNCKETINTSVSHCPFCAAPVDSHAAEAAADFMSKVNQACSDAIYLRIVAGAMVAFAFLRYVPFVGMAAGFGFIGLLFAVPVMTIRWWSKFGAVQSESSDFLRAKRNTKVALGIWAVVAFLFVIAVAIRVLS